jgi:hypothetical protein
LSVQTRRASADFPPDTNAALHPGDTVNNCASRRAGVRTLRQRSRGGVALHYRFGTGELRLGWVTNAAAAKITIAHHPGPAVDQLAEDEVALRLSAVASERRLSRVLGDT